MKNVLSLIPIAIGILNLVICCKRTRAARKNEINLMYLLSGLAPFSARIFYVKCAGDKDREKWHIISCFVLRASNADGEEEIRAKRIMSPKMGGKAFI